MHQTPEPEKKVATKIETKKKPVVIPVEKLDVCPSLKYIPPPETLSHMILQLANSSS